MVFDLVPFHSQTIGQVKKNINEKMKKKLTLLALSTITMAVYACIQGNYPQCGPLTLNGTDAWGDPCSCTANNTTTYKSVKSASTGYNSLTWLGNYDCTYSCDASTPHGTHTLTGDNSVPQAQPDPNSGKCPA
jgi:hypothetical protein